MDSGELLDQLKDRGSRISGAVASADIVLVTIGANDFSSDHGTVTDGDCFEDGKAECTRDELSQMKKDVTAILARIRRLREGRPTSVLVTGYWNVFESGDVARSSYSQRGIGETRELTSHVNSVLRAVAVQAGDTYVDLVAPFNGPASRGDITTLLAPDGDHPNAAGHRLIAHELVAAGLRGLARNQPRKMG